MLTTYGDKAPHHLFACVCVCVCVFVCISMCACMCVCVCACMSVSVNMHVCESVNMDSTTYRIHQALPNTNNLQR